MHQRQRRPWQPHEDDLLRAAVAKEDPSDTPSKWYAIAKHVPNRTNKDCRKRWFAKMASDVTKGGWAPDEDERLIRAIERYGTRWSMVSTMVQTRNSDQCSKRWCDTLDPSIDRTSWTPEADEILLRAVQEHGKVWTKIVKSYFPGRTGLSAKNRYNSITRFQSRSSTPPSQRQGYLDTSCSQLPQQITSSPSAHSTDRYNLSPQMPSSYSFSDSDSCGSTPSPYSTDSITLNTLHEEPILTSCTYDQLQSLALYTYPPPTPTPQSAVLYISGRHPNGALDFAKSSDTRNPIYAPHDVTMTSHVHGSTPGFDPAQW